MSRTTRIVLAILTILTLAAGVGFYFVKTLPESVAGIYLPLVYMPTPLLSLIVAKYAFKRDIKILPPLPKAREILPSLGLVVALVASWFVLTLLASAVFARTGWSVFGTFVGSSEAVRDQIEQLVDEQIPANIPVPGPAVIAPLMIVQGILIGGTLNAIPAFGEEALWRGYLVSALQRSFYPKYLTIGAIWGLWHAPLNIQGYNYGDNNALAGAALFVVDCMVLSLVFGIVAERTGNVIYAAMLHGMFNAIALSVDFFVITDYPLISGPIGLVAIATMLVVFLLFRRWIPQRTDTPVPDSPPAGVLA